MLEDFRANVLKETFRHRHRRHCFNSLFSSLEPVACWSRGLEIGVRYKLSRVTLETRMVDERKRFEYAWWTHIFSKTEKSDLRFQRYGWTRSENFCCLRSLICRKVFPVAPLSSTGASFYRREGEGDGKRKRAILLGYPAGPPAGASTEERAVAQQIPTDE